MSLFRFWKKLAPLISMHRRVVVDSSVLIALSRKGELEDRLRRWKSEGIEVKVPKAIAEEVVDEPKKSIWLSRPCWMGLVSTLVLNSKP